MIELVTVCPFCGHKNYILVFEDDYLAWEAGTLAQIAFPYLTADEREALISGICPDCWDSLFAEEDE